MTLLLPQQIAPVDALQAELTSACLAGRTEAIMDYFLGRLLPGLQSACDYMIDLMRRDGFRQAEAWLREGPPPPPDLVLAGMPADLRPWTRDGREESVMACQRACAAGCEADEDWRKARVLDYVRLVRPQVASMN